MKKIIKLFKLPNKKCQNSKNYKFIPEKPNFYIKCDTKQNYYYVDWNSLEFIPFIVYFKTKKDAIKICNILNKKKVKYDKF